jgi:hypothetical protein
MTKQYGNLLAGGRSLHFDAKDGNAGEAKAVEEDTDSDLEILREEASNAQKEQLRQQLLQAEKRQKGGRAGTVVKNQPEETWKDRQLVARSRAWLKKTDTKEEEEDEIALGDTSEDDSPFPKTKFNRRNQQRQSPAAAAESAEIEEVYDAKSPDFTTAVPSASKETVKIRLQDKNGNKVECRVKMKQQFGKLYKVFKASAAANVRMYTIVYGLVLSVFPEISS